LVILTGCGPSHIKQYVPKQREYSLPATEASAPQEPSPGSLMRPDGASTIMFSDPRAFRTNDVLIVKIEEVADAQRKSEVDLQRGSSSQHGIKALPFFDRIVNDNLRGRSVNLEQETNAEGSGQDAFNAQGSTGRTERFLATVPVVVKRVLPNGNLFVEGHRVILVNEEEHHFYVSGVVRPIDIDQGNSVRSSQVADAEIEFVGRGVVNDNEQEGWFKRAVNILRPW
jgi:flagellar L-ring protein precursor FlgH